MAPTRRRRQEEGLRPPPMTGRCTRSSMSLRGAPPAEIRVQSSFNHRPPRTRDIPTAMSKTRSGKGHTSYRRRVHDATSPQRSSLRRALRESQKLTDEIRVTVISSPPDPVPAEIQVPPQEPENSFGGVPTGVGTRSAAILSAKSHYVPALKVNPQRTSLRRATRESLKGIDTYEDTSPPTYFSVSSLEPVEKSSADTQNQAISVRNPRRDAWLSSNPASRVLSISTPQRSSLRRAIRESLCAIVQSNAYVDIASGRMSTVQDMSSKNTIEKTFLPSSNGQSDEAVLLSDSQPASLDTSSIPPEGGDFMESPPRLSRTSSISPITASPAPLTPVASRVLAALGSRKRWIPGSYLRTESSTSQSSFSQSKPSSYLILTPEPHGEPGSPTAAARHSIPSTTSMDQSILGNGTLQKNPSNSRLASARKGWHQVREITNEVPGGLYLVEWEGQDPRTGVKWPASWVKAENVSESAIYDWEKRKHEMLLGIREN
ncbi:hypothetical protein F5Y12DRAFT_788636 [Xylaria sp. FL1777]|nr:hypothetical protein F5Y12DRAFT_788636 [Xylaria sp. FL1777]